MSEVSIVVLIQLTLHLIVAVINRFQWLRHIGEKEKGWQIEKDKWGIERQLLLDRIQAPSFDHLKHAEVKILKAQSGEKEPPKPVME